MTGALSALWHGVTSAYHRLAMEKRDECERQVGAIIRSGREIAEMLSTYLVRGLLRRPSADPIAPAAG